MTEATYSYIDTADPTIEVFNLTTAPTNGLTLTSRRFSRPLFRAVAWMEQPAASGPDVDAIYSSSVSSNVVTLGVNGTGRKCVITLTENKVTD